MQTAFNGHTTETGTMNLEVGMSTADYSPVILWNAHTLHWTLYIFVFCLLLSDLQVICTGHVRQLLVTKRLSMVDIYNPHCSVVCNEPRKSRNFSQQMTDNLLFTGLHELPRLPLDSTHCDIHGIL